MIRRALVFQHMDDEPPGLFGDFLRERGAALDTVMLHRGETIPSLAPYDFLLVMGGAMDVWEEEAHPWLAAEKAAIREWALKRNRPYLGICLGLQLLAALEREALARDLGLVERRLHAAELGHQRDARTLVERPAVLAGVLLETLDSAENERVVVGHLLFARPVSALTRIPGP